MMKQNIENLKDKIGELDKLCGKLTDTKKDIEKLQAMIGEVDKSWSRSWIGYHSNMYYKEFEEPRWQEAFNAEWGGAGMYGISREWESRSYENVENYIQAKASLKFVDVLASVEEVVQKGKELQELFCTELIVIEGEEKYNKENEVIKELGKYKWGISAGEIIRIKSPKQAMSRDSIAIQQGLKTPPHIECEAKLVSCLSQIESIETFIVKANRLIRQVEIKINLNPKSNEASNAIKNIEGICQRFHNISRQLRNRHSSRATIEIEDEYDVQDLFHALLKLYFEDVRSEEWVPSYAGRATRADFLLKNEQIVIEIKKTRNGLADKEVGEQLIIDIAKYRAHPDCKVLLCFVYDPEGRIGNPAGIENDLNQLSTNEINVMVMIRPR